MTVEDKPDVTYEDVGGAKDALEKLREVVELPLLHPERFVTLGIDPPKGVLLFGPPGTGKTLSARVRLADGKGEGDEICIHMCFQKQIERAATLGGLVESGRKEIGEDLSARHRGCIHGRAAGGRCASLACYVCVFFYLRMLGVVGCLDDYDCLVDVVEIDEQALSRHAGGSVKASRPSA